MPSYLAEEVFTVVDHPPCTSEPTTGDQDDVDLAPQRHNNVHVGVHHPARVTTHTTELSCQVYLGRHVVHEGGQATSVYPSHMADLYRINRESVSFQYTLRANHGDERRTAVRGKGVGPAGRATIKGGREEDGECIGVAVSTPEWSSHKKRQAL